MSWEITGTESVSCPCGKGTITRTDYGDDWNRFQEEISIECQVCKEKYDLITNHYYKHAGDSGEVHYLLEKGYPEYTGTRLRDVFPDTVSIEELPFDVYLIKVFSLKDLTTALIELNSKTAVSELTGIAADIAKRHKRAFHSARIAVLRNYVQEAFGNYDNYPDNKDRRIPIERQEEQERSAYNAERRKHMIHIPL